MYVIYEKDYGNWLPRKYCIEIVKVQFAEDRRWKDIN